MTKYLTLLGLLILTSCTRLKDIPVETSFQGINSEFSNQEPINILTVHGLGGYAKGNPEFFEKTIKQKLKLTQVENPITRHIFKGNDYYGYLVHTDFKNASHTVRIYNLFWYPTTALARSTLEKIDEQSSSNRMEMVQEMKEKYVDNTLADAVLYVSDYRKEIQYPFEKSFEWIVNEIKGQQITIVGYSLGSTIVIDTLDEMKNQGVALDFIKQMKEIFMLSNPSPLFELSKWNRVTEQFSWEWKDWSIGRIVSEKRKYSPNFKVIAFSDPNDPLSYIVENYYIPSDSGWQNAFKNIQVRNIKWAIFGMINPIEAHTGYGRNKKVLDMIIFGNE